MDNDDSFSPNEKEMDLMANKFSNFFRINKNSSGGPKRESLSMRDSRLVKKIEYSCEENDKHHNRRHANKIKCFNWRRLGYIIAQC